jgi:hypothetical protein
MSGQLHGPAALTPGKALPVTNGCGCMWMVYQIVTSAAAGKYTTHFPNSPVCGTITIRIELS